MSHNIEELASKAVGLAKAAKASFEGLSGVFRHLVREHGEVSALLMRLKISSSPQTRRELWPVIRAELLSHERAERQVVYPAFGRDPDLRAMATEHDADANGLEDAVGELDRTAADSDQWQPNLERLIALVEEHVSDEEQEYFPIADRVLAERSQALLDSFEKVKAEAKSRLAA